MNIAFCYLECSALKYSPYFSVTSYNVEVWSVKEEVSFLDENICHLQHFQESFEMFMLFSSSEPDYPNPTSTSDYYNYGGYEDYDR